MVCVFCISHVPALLTLPIRAFEGRNHCWIASWSSWCRAARVQDCGAELFGRAQGGARAVAFEDLEGLIGGVASATAMGAGAVLGHAFKPWQGALMAFMICLLGYRGLVIVGIKRDRV